MRLNFPEDLNLPEVRVLDRKSFATPFGESPEFTIFTVDDETVLTMKMHGWRPDVKRADASRQVFRVFEQAGVKNILAEGGVGWINLDFKLRDFIIPDDYIDLSMRKDVRLSDKYLLINAGPRSAPTLQPFLPNK